MSTPQEKNPLYVDFKETGGVVHSRPTRLLPDLVFTGKTKSQLDIELEQHARMVQETLGESAYEGGSLEKAVNTARPIFLDLSLPFPGLTELKDNFYTGWFYTSEGGRIYSACRKRDGFSLSPYLNQIRRSAYFLLDKTEAESWDERIKQNPLTVQEIDELFLSPGMDAHPSYEGLSRLNLKELTDKASATADSFWTTLNTFDRSDRSNAKRDFLRNNLIDLVILDQIHDRSHRAALAEVRESMEKNEITVFPLSQDGCVVRYISDLTGKYNIGSDQLTVRTLPLPHNLMGNFQRYGRLGERPMTEREFETTYKRLVDPNTKLF